MSQSPRIELRIPDFGGEAGEVTIVTWLKGVGDAVVQGEPILEVMTDKANVEVESPAAGVLLEQLAEKDAVVKVDAVVGTIGAGVPT